MNLPTSEAKFSCVVLTMRASDNAYGDDGDVYVYPERYRAAFAPLEAGEQMLALVYEPGRGGGRMAYVAWSLLSAPPQPAGRTVGGQSQWMVRHDGGLVPLPRPVAQEEGGHVFETRLRLVPKVERGPTQRGVSVRALSFEDFCSVLSASGLVPPAPQAPEAEVHERQRAAVSRLVRDRGFRLRVLSAYGWRCAVTGWSAPPSLAHGLLEAAHLIPVAAGGSDSVRNGLALTATIHRLFDAGALGFHFEDGLWRLQRFAPLEAFHLQGVSGSLSLVQGQPLLMPTDLRLWPAMPGV